MSKNLKNVITFENNNLHLDAYKSDPQIVITT
jgi:hypothetical protein